MILVTGHKGFIGRNLTDFLHAHDQEVWGFDAVDGDPIELAKDVPWETITKIYHLGAISNTTELDVLKIQRWNVESSIGILEKAIHHNIPVTYASSGSVYGNSMVDGRYDYNPLNYYAISKLTVDLWVKENLSRFTSPVIGLRYFNVYGKDEKKADFCTSPVYRFSEQAKDTGIIRIFSGSHKTYRDFVCVDDVVKLTVTATNTGTYDVGCRNPISFLDVAEMVANRFKATIQFIPFPEVIKGKYQLYSKAQNDFPGYKFTQVEEYVERMI